MSFCCLLSFIVFPGFAPGVAAAGDSETKEISRKAIDFIHQKYKNGEKIDAYTAYVLTLSGEDLDSTKWGRNGKTLKKEIQNLADMLGDQNSLIDYTINTQNGNGSYGPFVNEYGP